MLKHNIYFIFYLLHLKLLDTLDCLKVLLHWISDRFHKIFPIYYRSLGEHILYNQLCWCSTFNQNPTMTTIVGGRLGLTWKGLIKYKIVATVELWLDNLTDYTAEGNILYSLWLECIYGGKLNSAENNRWLSAFLFFWDRYGAAEGGHGDLARRWWRQRRDLWGCCNCKREGKGRQYPSQSPGWWWGWRAATAIMMERSRHAPALHGPALLC